LGKESAVPRLFAIEALRALKALKDDGTPLYPNKRVQGRKSNNSLCSTTVSDSWNCQTERFEKLVPFPILGLRRNFLKGVKRSAAAEQAFTGSGTSGLLAVVPKILTVR
jgi:hypothetical protein